MRSDARGVVANYPSPDRLFAMPIPRELLFQNHASINARRDIAAT